MNNEEKINVDTNEAVINNNEEKTVKSRNGDIKYYLRICLTLLIISAVTATLLALVNAVTKDRIAQNELAVMEEALGRIFVGCDEIKPVEGEYDEPVAAVYEVYSEGKLLGFGIQSAPVGFKDVIGLIVGADIEGNCLGVEITSISDTPGVGTKVKDTGFLGGFKGLNGDSVTEYDTITGATISSKAVKGGVEAVLKLDIFVPDGETGSGEGSEAETKDEASAETSAETSAEASDANGAEGAEDQTDGTSAENVPETIG